MGVCGTWYVGVCGMGVCSMAICSMAVCGMGVGCIIKTYKLSKCE